MVLKEVTKKKANLKLLYSCFAFTVFLNNIHVLSNERTMIFDTTGSRK